MSHGCGVKREARDQQSIGEVQSCLQRVALGAKLPSKVFQPAQPPVRRLCGAALSSAKLVGSLTSRVTENTAETFSVSHWVYGTSGRLACGVDTTRGPTDSGLGEIAGMGRLPKELDFAPGVAERAAGEGDGAEG